MKKIVITLLTFLPTVIAFGQNVGIGTTTPITRLHVVDSSVLFTGPFDVGSAGVIPPPIEGAGTRFMWYAPRAAFRVGGTASTSWDNNFIGLYSFASGFNNTASGPSSTAVGYNNQALGAQSFATGNSTTASGGWSTSMGMGTVASNNYSLVIGRYNTTSITNSLFEIGYGLDNSIRRNAFTVLSNGNVGIGISTPSNLLSFAPSLGKKISLYPGPDGEAGFAINPNELRMYSDNSNADITFGNDNYSTGFAEKMRIKSNGNVGIGEASPGNPLSFPAVGGKKISLYPGTLGEAGFAIAPNELRMYSDYSGADITFGFDSYASGFSEKVRFKASGMVGIGTATPTLSTGTSGMVVQNNTYIQMRVQSSSSAAGLEFKPSSGHQYEIQADNTNKWFVYDRTANAFRLVINTLGQVGIGTALPTQALEVAGNIIASGTITPSDFRYKKNIQPIQSALSKLVLLNGVTYDYRTDEFPEKKFNEGEQLGLIAQEVEKIFPQLVVTDNKGYKAVDYVKLVPVLIESTKEQQSQIDGLKQQVDALQKLVQSLIKK